MQVAECKYTTYTKNGETLFLVEDNYDSGEPLYIICRRRTEKDQKYDMLLSSGEQIVFVSATLSQEYAEKTIAKMLRERVSA